MIRPGLASLSAVLMCAWVAAVSSRGAASNDPFPDISIADLKAAIDANGVTLLDANGTDSWRKAHIPGALDYNANQAKLADLLPKDKDSLIVAYCGGPQCHAYEAAAKAAKAMGYTNIRHLSAGISGWQQANEKTEKGP